MNEMYPRAADFEVLTPEVDARWQNFGQWDRTYFPKLVGLHVEETRLGYCRMVLSYREELEQPVLALKLKIRSPSEIINGDAAIASSGAQHLASRRFEHTWGNDHQKRQTGHGADGHCAQTKKRQGLLFLCVKPGHLLRPGAMQEQQRHTPV